MIDFTSQIVLSVSDLIKALQKNFKWLILAALICGSLLVCIQLNLSKPYTAEASYLLKNALPLSSNIFDLLSRPPQESSQARDPEFSIQSINVISNTVKKLGLQASLQEVKHHYWLKNQAQIIWRNILVSKAYRHYKNRHYGNRLVLFDPPFINKEPSLTVQDIEYANTDYAQSFNISFVTDTEFEVSNKGKFVGKGSLATPFKFPQGKFTLVGQPKKKYLITLLPMKLAINEIKSQCIIHKNKKTKCLLPVQFKHRSAHLAQKILNTLLESCQEDLQNDGNEKISHQLNYLKERQNQVIQNLESILLDCKNSLATSMNKGDFLATNIERELLTKIQLHCHDTQANSMQKMQHLYARAFGKSMPIQSIVEDVRAMTQEIEFEELTTESSLKLIAEYEALLEKLHLNREQCQNLITHLREESINPGFLTSAASKFSLDILKILAINRKIGDEANYSLKEREGLWEALQLEKKIHISTLEQIAQGVQVEEASCRTRLRFLQKQALALLLRDFEIADQSLMQVTKKLGDFPDKWLQEEKIELTKTLQLSTFSELSMQIESKNLSYHLDYLETHPYQLATLPLLPKSPKLELWGLVGALIGAFLMSCSICLREIFLGPTASYDNLTSAKCRTIGYLSSDSLRQIATLTENSHSIFICSKQPLTVAKELRDILTKRGNNVLIMDEPKEELIGFKGFTFDHSYDKVIVWHQGIDPLTFLLRQRVDQTIFVVSDERAKDLSFFPINTLYLFKKMLQKPPLLSLKKIQPILQRFFSSLPHTSASGTTSTNHDKQSPDLLEI